MSGAHPHWRSLDFDSERLGRRVGRIEDPQLHGAELQACLASARAAGVELLYWLCDLDALPAEAELAEHSGRVVDHRRVYLRETSGELPSRGTSAPTIQRYAGERTGASLRALALAAGESSRFAVDPRIGRAGFEALYGAWIDNCVAGTRADAVYVIPGEPQAPQQLGGMITLDRSQRRSNIGLIAVEAHARGRGWGKALVRRALEHAREAGLARAQVVTQRRNTAACALYESCGYTLEGEQAWVHFAWEGG